MKKSILVGLLTLVSYQILGDQELFVRKKQCNEINKYAWKCLGVEFMNGSISRTTEDVEQRLVLTCSNNIVSYNIKEGSNSWVDWPNFINDVNPTKFRKFLKTDYYPYVFLDEYITDGGTSVKVKLYCKTL